MSRRRKLNELAEAITLDIRKRQSKAALQNAICLMAHDFKLCEISEILRSHADQIEELG